VTHPKCATWDTDHFEMKLQNSTATTDAAIDLFAKAGRWLDRGNLDEAARLYCAALEADADLVEARYNLGLVYQRMGRYDEAAACYRKTFQRRPDDSAALNNLGQILALTGNHSKAERVYRRAIALEPRLAEPHFNLGELSVLRDEPESAIAYYRRAIQLRPNMLEAYNNLGTVFQQQQNFRAAEKCYRKVVGLNPELAEGHYNLGSALKQLDRFQEAVRHLKHAIALKPKYKEAFNNLALAYKNRGELDVASTYFTRALAIDPAFAEAHWNRSFTYLLRGELQKGWEDFEWRFKQPRWKSLYPFRLNGPRWDGSMCHDLRLLVHDEQGLGDTLQFVRYLPRLKERVGTVIFETRRTLMPLLAGFPGIDEIIERSADGSPKAHYDTWVALMSLPYLLKTRLSNIPDGIPYLTAPDDKVLAWKKRINGTGLKIGIVWAGRPEHMNDRNRSCRLEQFSKLADLPGLQWYSLQKGTADSQLDEWRPPPHIKNLGAVFDDFTDTAGAIANLDLVITVDTSVAHLAGAMGAQVWVLLPYIPDWRWMMGRQDSPWYPTMRLFRQPEAGNWSEVFSELKDALRQRLQKAA
jgi:tetratricopeptide (TPR) repeat protein